MTTGYKGPARQLAWSGACSQAAEQVSLAAVPLVALTTLQAGPAEVGLLAVAQMLPLLLLAVPLGVFADRSRRLPFLVTGEGLRCMSLLGMLAIALFGQWRLEWLGAAAFVSAIGTAMYGVAAPALVSSIVPRHALAPVNSLLELGRGAAFGMGPALAGVLMSASGAALAWLSATALSAIAMTMLPGLPDPAVEGPRRRKVLRDAREAARFVWAEPHLRTVLTAGVAFEAAWFVLQAAYLPYALASLGLASSHAAMVFGIYGAGMVAGALAARVLPGLLQFGHAVQAGPVTALAAALAMALSAGRPFPWLAAAACFFLGAAPALWAVTTTTLRQKLVPNPLLARASALFLAAHSLARAVGAVIGGFAGFYLGVPACLLMAVGLLGLQLWMMRASPLVDAPHPASADSVP